MEEFKYKLKPEEIKELIPSMGYCYASDMVTVDGYKVGFMHREAREEEGDSGWRFYSGFETEEYVDDEHNIMMFDVNYIANLDPAIIPYLKLRTGAELERVEGTDKFERI
ncbi:MAG TPA: DUF2185 domain-containing protein [Tenuifilaceae bacterium]|nr:DUF2185 domain-containing protein [Tenuifilaceae bacterium]HPE19369.1 DUF2185 domain-containing protein [Tenuifilaceae bacterium]HPJ46198.1 DUF2185 domain-containing protein [Tenuifilaceae bacterium]HPQ34201.1 DUF2185 domain-containing protein [Tenuifilaceae bacterium]HRX67864.1 DUF2185 domain-containing protein [Tenuifilaceae bacterium]